MRLFIFLLTLNPFFLNKMCFNDGCNVCNWSRDEWKEDQNKEEKQSYCEGNKGGLNPVFLDLWEGRGLSLTKVFVPKLYFGLFDDPSIFGGFEKGKYHVKIALGDCESIEDWSKITTRLVDQSSALLFLWLDSSQRISWLSSRETLSSYIYFSQTKHQFSRSQDKNPSLSTLAISQRSPTVDLIKSSGKLVNFRVHGNTSHNLTVKHMMINSFFVALTTDKICDQTLINIMLRSQ